MSKLIIPKDINSMLNLLFEYGIAMPDQIVGISLSELKQLEDSYGKFPQDYRDILLAIGKNAGQLISNRDEFQLYYDDIIDLNEDIRESRIESIREGEEIIDLPENIFFINARYFGDPYFIQTNRNNDSTLFQFFKEAEIIELKYESVWELFAGFILECKYFIDLDNAKTKNEIDKVSADYSDSGLFG